MMIHGLTLLLLPLIVLACYKLSSANRWFTYFKQSGLLITGYLLGAAIRLLILLSILKEYVRHPTYDLQDCYTRDKMMIDDFGLIGMLTMFGSIVGYYYYKRREALNLENN
ncbi:hypothetical protein [Xanthocytophaga flavus]|nr:hypothetical protein [Xanthocytophaga flavus]